MSVEYLRRMFNRDGRQVKDVERRVNTENKMNEAIDTVVKSQNCL